MGRHFATGHSVSSASARAPNINILLVNCRSVKNKADELASLLSSLNTDIVLGCESWLDESITNSEVFPFEYEAYRKDRNSHGGGVFILVKKTMPSFPMNISDTSCESVWCKLVLQNGEHITMAAFYRAPGGNSIQPFLSLSDQLQKVTTDYFLIGGDFNMPDVRWINKVPVFSSKASLTTAFGDLIACHGLFQFVDIPTRCSSANANTLDLLFSNSPSLIQSVTAIPGISDHVGITAKVLCDRPPLPAIRPRKVYLYERGDYDAIAMELENYFPLFESYSAAPDITYLWLKFKEKIFTLIDLYIPFKILSGKQRSNKPWFTREIKTLINKRKRMFKKHRAHPEPDLFVSLEQVSDLIKRKIKSAKSTFFLSLGSKIKDNPKEFWKLVKSNRKDDTGIPSLTCNNNSILDDVDKAKSFNEYFESVFSKSQSRQLPTCTSQIFEPMPEIIVDGYGVLKLLQSIKPNSAPGPDGIPNLILKSCAPVISKYLTLLYNISVSSSTLPEDWKIGNVVPIHKNGSRDLVENYRPISLTSVCCKTLEHIIYTAIINHLQNNHFFVDYQHGFRSGRSCSTQLIEFSHDILKSFDNGVQTDCVLLDFQKAFDKVSHNLLLYKLSFLGLPNNILSWLQNYLTGRSQKVVVNGVSSTNVSVSSGVPQGSVLGPLLFLIYINDIGVSISSSIRLYADDCVLYREIRDDSDRLALQTDLEKICFWCSQWLMSLNVSKCNHIQFSRKRKPFQTQYSLNNETIPQVTHAKYLGVVFSSDLTWNQHVEFITTKAARTLYFIRRNFKQAPQDVKELLYSTNVRPILEYGSTVWDPFTQNLIGSLEAIQNRAARFVKNSYVFPSSITRIKDSLGWPTLASRRAFFRISFLRDVYFNQTPLNKDVYLMPPTYVSRRLDHTLKIREMPARTNAFMNSFFPRTIQTWNQLPRDIIQVASDDKFLVALRNHLQA